MSSGKVTTLVVISSDNGCAGNLQQQQRRGPQPHLRGVLRAPPQTHSPCASSCCLCLCFCSCCGCGCAAHHWSLCGPWSFGALWSAPHVWRGGLCCLLGMGGGCCSASYIRIDGHRENPKRSTGSCAQILSSCCRFSARATC